MLLQALNVVEAPEFRELVLYCGQGRIKDQDMLHRDKLATAALAMYILEKGKIDNDMKYVRGRISLTSDLWSNGSLCSFMAVTAHYIDKDGFTQDHHTGANIGQALFDVLQESNIAEKVGHITLDNASNNNTLMQELAAALGARGIEFDAQRNRIRCFPHVMNLAVNEILKSLVATAASFRAEMSATDLPIDQSTELYLQALEASGLRREGLHNAILEGNRLGRFRGPGGDVYSLPVLQLLREMPTRWSSSYNMIDRYIVLYPAIVDYAFRACKDAQIPVVSHKQYEVLQDILSVLRVAHNAQELLSAEKTPTLALAFPIYEAVIEHWEKLCAVIPELSHSITCGILKLQEYVTRTQDAPVHALAMAINPSLKLDWIKEHWAPTQALEAEAEAAMKAEMHRFQALLSSGGTPSTSSTPSHATQAQSSGYVRVLTSGTALRRASSLHAPGESSGHTNIMRQSSTPVLRHSSGWSTYAQVDTEARNEAIVDEEFTRYMNAGLTPTEKMGSFELTDFWKCHQYTYPLLFRIAMDVLPVQASSVSSERVFSSSKLTCTSERNRITPENMEYLQVLKHALARKRRNPTLEGLVAPKLDFVTHLYENLSLEDD
ncbi:hypothetical protein FRC10_003305 [Ceratobasidium sp. 414]|nr:hypothetical protein FRC10_003305 [Ceratobasidium sp. 414]